MTYLITYTETMADGTKIRREQKVIVLPPANLNAVRLAFWQTVHVYGEIVTVTIVNVQEIFERAQAQPARPSRKGIPEEQ